MALEYKKEGRIATITLNRPEALNALDPDSLRGLFKALTAMREDEEVWVGIITSTGEKAFCAGADLTEFLSAPSPTAARHARRQRDVWGLFLSLPQPVIAALHGYVFGSGIEMAMCCDIRIAADNCIFGLPEVALGIIPAAGATQTVPRAIGPGPALDLLLTGRRIGAQEALEMKLVNRMVPRSDLLPAVDALANKIAGFDQQAVRMVKEAVSRGLDLPLSE